jgi:hypothetical protein
MSGLIVALPVSPVTESFFLLALLGVELTTTSGNGEGLGRGALFLLLLLFTEVELTFIEIGEGVVLNVVLTEERGFRVGLPEGDPKGTLVEGTLAVVLVDWMSVGMTRVLTTVVVMELKINVVVVTVVEPESFAVSEGVSVART